VNNAPCTHSGSDGDYALVYCEKRHASEESQSLAMSSSPCRLEIACQAPSIVRSWRLAYSRGKKPPGLETIVDRRVVDHDQGTIVPYQRQLSVSHDLGFLEVCHCVHSVSSMPQRMSTRLTLNQMAEEIDKVPDCIEQRCLRGSVYQQDGCGAKRHAKRSVYILSCCLSGDAGIAATTARE